MYRCLNILPVGWLLTFVTSDSVVEGFVVVLVGITASTCTVVVKEVSVSAIHNQNTGGGGSFNVMCSSCAV